MPAACELCSHAAGISFIQDRVMNLQAVTIGGAIPAHAFQGQVHSVFDSLVNVRVTGADELVTLFTSPSTDLPQGIRLQPEQGFHTHSCEVGQPACRLDEFFYLPSAGWRIDLSTARLWRCDWSGDQIDLASPAVRAAWLSVNKMLCNAQPGPGQPALARSTAARLSAGLAGLQQAAASLAPPAAQASAAALAGLGPGLTPAGDDMLLGFGAGLWGCAGKDSRRLAFVQFYGQLLRHAAARANDISRTYLLLAARGQFSSPLMHLVQAIAQAADAPALRRATQQVLQLGHSSGRDTTAGLLAGLSAWGEFF
jgi:hypothetical protein